MSELGPSKWGGTSFNHLEQAVTKYKHMEQAEISWNYLKQAGGT